MSGPTHQTLILRHVGPACLTVAQLAEQLHLTTDQVGQAARLLIRRGLLERVARGCFQLTDSGIAAAAAGVEITSGPANLKERKIPPRTRASLQQRAWNVMRLRRRFTVPELVTCAAGPRDAGPDDTVQRYLRALARAGYAAAVDKRAEGRRDALCKVYTLLKDTGHIAPSVVRRGKAVFDHNTGEEVALCTKE